MLPCFLTHHPINTLMPLGGRIRSVLPPPHSTDLPRNPLLPQTLALQHFGSLCVRQDEAGLGTVHLGYLVLPWEWSCHMELNHASSERSCVKAAGAGSSVTSSEQYPGTGVTLEASPRAVISRFRCGRLLQGLTWLNPWPRAQFCEFECLACSQNPVMLSVWFDPVTSWSLLIPGKHGGPPWSSEYPLPPLPKSCSPLAPAPLTPLVGPCRALHVSLCHQTSVLSPLLP